MTRIVTAGSLNLDPPGLSFDVSELFEGKLFEGTS